MEAKRVIKTVLLIEDMDILQKMITGIIHRLMGEDVVVIVAGSLKMAEAKFAEHMKDIDLILMDTNLGKGETTFGLVSKISKVFDHHIVSISMDPNNHEGMLMAGCTDSCLKDELYKYIKERRFEQKNPKKKV